MHYIKKRLFCQAVYREKCIQYKNFLTCFFRKYYINFILSSAIIFYNIYLLTNNLQNGAKCAKITIWKNKFTIDADKDQLVNSAQHFVAQPIKRGCFFLGKSFVKGAAILTLAGVLGKMMGALYRIPFNRIAGEEAASLYGLVYPVYSILLALSTAGIPLAVSKLIAEQEKKGDTAASRRIFFVTLTVLTAIGVLAALGLYFASDWIALNWLHEPRAALSLKAIAPALLFTCLMSTMRGYFQGLQQMIPTAVSQVVEQFARVATIFVMLYLLLDYGVVYIAAGASLGAAVGGCTSFLVLLAIFIWFQRKHPWSKGESELNLSGGQIMKKVIALAIPISIGALVLPIMQLIDSFMIIPRLMAGGIAQEQALIQSGYISSYANPIINLPFIITTALSASLVPAVAEALTVNDKDKVKADFRTAMLLAVIIVFPAAVGLCALAEPICVLLYDKAAAGVALAWVSFTVIAVGLYQTSSGCLQGMGKVYIPMASLIIGAVVKIILTYILTPLSFLGIRGAALGTVIGFGIAALSNILALSKIIGFDWFDLKRHFLKPAVSVIIMAVVVLAVYALTSGLGNSLATLIAIAIGGSVYFLVLLILGGIKAEEIAALPKIGRPLAKIVTKISKK